MIGRQKSDKEYVLQHLLQRREVKAWELKQVDEEIAKLRALEGADASSSCIAGIIKAWTFWFCCGTDLDHPPREKRQHLGGKGDSGGQITSPKDKDGKQSGKGRQHSKDEYDKYAGDLFSCNRACTICERAGTLYPCRHCRGAFCHRHTRPDMVCVECALKKAIIKGIGEEGGKQRGKGKQRSKGN